MHYVQVTDVEYGGMTDKEQYLAQQPAGPVSAHFFHSLLMKLMDMRQFFGMRGLRFTMRNIGMRFL